MKYAVVLGDGMADRKIESLGGKTCLEYAKTPNIDKLAPHAEAGMFRTVPAGFNPGSDVANMSVMGFDPKKYYSGRSPLEAVAMGIPLKDTDVTLRANLVTLSGDGAYEDMTMADYSSGEITTAEATELITFLKRHLDGDGLTLYPGISYRHCLVAENGVTGHDFTPPHDISDKKITQYRLAKDSGIAYTTINDICSGKAQLEKCSAETIYRISKVLGVSMESLIEPCFDKRSDFELFKSNTCHRLKELGDIEFVIELLEEDYIR